MTTYSFNIQTDPIPYVRMTRRGKFVNPRAQEYLASQEALKLEFKNQMQLKGWEMLPTQTPLFISIDYFPTGKIHTRDLDNILKAISDAAQGIVFQNDLWIDHISVSRHYSSGVYPVLVEIGIDTRQNYACPVCALNKVHDG